jgi:hypothetical protein
LDWKVGKGDVLKYDITVVKAKTEQACWVVDGAVITLGEKDTAIFRMLEESSMPFLALTTTWTTPEAFKESVQKFTKIREGKVKWKPLVLHLPLADGRVVDLVNMKVYVYTDAAVDIQEVPKDLKETIETYRKKIAKVATDCDENPYDAAGLKRAIRCATVKRSIVPVLAIGNHGGRLLLELVVDYLPSPSDIGKVHGFYNETSNTLERDTNSNGAFCALVFDVMDAGNMTIARTFSGKIRKADEIFNACTGKYGRVRKIFSLTCGMPEIEEANAGCVVGLQFDNDIENKFDAKCGATLCDPKNPIQLLKAVRPDAPRRNALCDAHRIAAGALKRVADRFDEQQKEAFKSGAKQLPGWGKNPTEPFVNALIKELRRHSNEDGEDEAKIQRVDAEHTIAKKEARALPDGPTKSRCWS